MIYKFQKIFQKAKISKYSFFFGIFSMLISILCFVSYPNLHHILAFAQEANQTISMEETMGSIVSLIQPILKMMYIFMRPLLVIAGNALDNTFVYGEFLHLDSPLRQMRQIMKNFANFALGFLVIFNIARYALGFGDDTKVKDVITKALLAGLGIQLSRFAVGALIDVSTIVTYGVGGLPMTIMNQSKLKEQPILGINTIMDLSSMEGENSNKSDYKQYYTRGTHHFVRCEIYKGFIIGPSESQEKGIDVNLDPKYCVYDESMMVDINAIIAKASIENSTDPSKNFKNSDHKPIDMKMLNTRNDAIKSQIDLLYNGGNVGAASLENLIRTQNSDEQNKVTLGKISVDLDDYKMITLNKISDINKAGDRVKVFSTPCSEVNDGFCYYGQGTYLGDLLDQSKGFVGPLVTLYVSLMNLSDLHIATVGGGGGRTDYATFFEFLLKAITGILLLGPLLALAVVLIVRIAYLRIIIAVSPVLVIFGVFKDSLPDGLSGSASKYNATSLLGLIFAPVLPVFALSISILFLTTIQSSIHDQQHSGMREGLGMEVKHIEGTNTQCIRALGLFDVCYDVGENHQGGGFYLDFFARLIINGFGIALVRMLLWASFQASSITKGIADKVQNIATSALSSAPIIPIPGYGMTSAGAVKQVFGVDSNNGIIGQKMQQRNQKVSDDAGALKADIAPEKGQAQKNEFARILSSSGDYDEALTKSGVDANKVSEMLDVSNYKSEESLRDLAESMSEGGGKKDNISIETLKKSLPNRIDKKIKAIKDKKGKGVTKSELDDLLEWINLSNASYLWIDPSKLSARKNDISNIKTDLDADKTGTLTIDGNDIGSYKTTGAEDPANNTGKTYSTMISSFGNSKSTSFDAVISDVNKDLDKNARFDKNNLGDRQGLLDVQELNKLDRDKLVLLANGYADFVKTYLSNPNIEKKFTTEQAIKDVVATIGGREDLLKNITNDVSTTIEGTDPQKFYTVKIEKSSGTISVA